ncbi:Leucine-rich receptor-like protein kinase family protein [Thalictrum thalictroides]|uniref:non-specific serine/threonine protein kinase n=1 Tax=Thalictrum thalictroides TaxID=46969 RepID=A0A7J6WK85_THATH|nr:Leucine-rich receptor-like protein kinase family protein [Thalictrum thalictroides]
MLYVVLVCIVLVYGEDSSDDHTALVSFLTGIVSDPEHVLESWNSTGVHMCAWKGVECNTARTHVVQLDLSGNSLQGTISPALSNLSYLTVLDLSDNLFSGHIPKELGLLFRLKQLSFSSNVLEGDIPTELGQLNRLVYFNVGSNRLEGQIPPSLFCNGTSSLQYVDLSNNSLIGKIPLWDQCELLELRFLLLWSNKLVGQIPPALSKSSKLEWLDLESNSLNGELPIEIVKYMPRLQFLYLSDNNFIAHDGNSNLTPFFASLVNCSKLQELEVAGNSLGGEIPSIIGDLSTSLVQINLGENHIYGSIPPSIANLVNVTLLNFSSNLLNGSIPSEISQMRKLERVYLSNNSFSGLIPSALGDIPHLGLLDLSKNRISAQLGNCIALESLNLSQNLLHGHFPVPIAKLPYLQEIDISSNQLTGDIQQFLQVSPTLKHLNISFNNFSGTIPNDGIFKSITVDSLQCNPGLCGSLSGMPPCKKKKKLRSIIMPVLIMLIGTPIVCCFAYPLVLRSRTRQKSEIFGEDVSDDEEQDTTRSKYPRISYRQLVEATGVAYLHHHAPMKVVHCDLKPSNILLDKDMTALVTDFGIAKLVKGGDGRGSEDPAKKHLFSTSSTEGLLCGSIGYIAPEYGLGRHASTEGDVYSFGVLLLEFITGKRPTDILFQEGFNLAEWVKSLFPNKLEPIAQQALLRFPPPCTPVYSTKIFQDVIYEIIELGLMCTQRSPSTRPNMLDVAHEMGWLKQYLSNPSTLPI